MYVLQKYVVLHLSVDRSNIYIGAPILFTNRSHLLAVWDKSYSIVIVRFIRWKYLS